MTITLLETPPGLVTDDTVHAAPGRWRDASMVRFYRGKWQIIGGWERLVLTTLGGACRSVFSWTDSSAVLNIAFGTHQTLEVWLNGVKSLITPTVGFTAGAVDGTGGAGVGTGAYGVGTYGSPSTSDFFPLTWSFGAFGQLLIANPRGQGIFAWANNAATPAALLAGAPARCNFVLSVPQRQVMAFGCSRESDGVYDPLAIRWSDIENPTVWTTSSSNNAGEYILDGGGRIVSARVVGDYLFVWTDGALYLGTYIGAPDQTWGFQRVGDNCGSISPGAPVITAQQAVWIAPDATFWSCNLGGAPQPMACPIRDDFRDNLALGQSDKIVGSTTSTFSEVCWFYPDGRDGLENSRDLRLSPDGWSRGRLARTAYTDANPTQYPVGVSYDAAAGTGSAYWHEKGETADGSAITGFIEGSDFFLGDGQGGLMITGVWPDFRDQVGQLKLTLYLKDRPQAAERAKGPWVISPGMAKRSLRATGRIVRIRWDFSSVPAFAREGALSWDVSPVGGR